MELQSKSSSFSLRTYCLLTCLKTGIYASDKETVKARAAALRSWLYQRSESNILFVTHGAFLHFLTEDWTGDDPVRGMLG